MTRWEYLSVRFDYVGRGITQDFNLLDINGERKMSWTGANRESFTTLPEFLRLVGAEGWELVSHAVNQDLEDNSLTWHYMHFKRPKIEA
jgi:hypothetical protein